MRPFAINGGAGHNSCSVFICRRIAAIGILCILAKTDMEICNHIIAHLSQVQRVLGRFHPGKLVEAVVICDNVRTNGGSLFLCGNGGSAAAALHAACDLTKCASVKGHRRLRATALVENAAILTAYSNDDGYCNVFVSQISGIFSERDALLGISTSGRSENVLRAMEYAQAIGAKTIGMSGTATERMRRCSTVMIELLGESIEATEDGHMILLHALSRALRAKLLAADETCQPALLNADM